MNRKKIIVKNGLIGLISQIVGIIFVFLTRSLFLKYIGIELLGINSTFTSILNALSLSELGFQSAVAYSLYKPLHDKNEEEINSIMNIFKMVYRAIGIFFIIMSLAMMPFLKYIINGIELTGVIYYYFILQALSSACTYFLAYKRVLLYADQREYISKVVDMLINVIFNILQCLCVIMFGSYSLYLILKIIQVFASNIIIHMFCRKNYTYLKKARIEISIFREIWKNVKNVFAGKIAGYIYGSTDSLIISSFVSTISVGYLVNYMTIINNLKVLVSSLLNPITPTIGHYLVDEKKTEKREEVFLVFTHIRYLIAVMIIIPAAILINEFIALWVGEKYILSNVIVWLLVIEFYIHLVHSVTADYISSAGLFKEAKYIEITGAVVNLVLSLIFVQIWGIAGVLVGTVISQMILWIGRSAIVYLKCFDDIKRKYLKYWLRNIAYILFFVLGYILCLKVCGKIIVENLLFSFIYKGILCECILIMYILIILREYKEQKILVKIIKGFRSK